jgi:hypothetical protein
MRRAASLNGRRGAVNGAIISGNAWNGAKPGQTALRRAYEGGNGTVEHAGVQIPRGSVRIAQNARECGAHKGRPEAVGRLREQFGKAVLAAAQVVQRLARCFYKPVWIVASRMGGRQHDGARRAAFLDDDGGRRLWVCCEVRSTFLRLDSQQRGTDSAGQDGVNKIFSSPPFIVGLRCQRKRDTRPHTTGMGA